MQLITITAFETTTQKIDFNKQQTMINDQDKSKEQLLQEYQELQQENDLLKEVYDRDNADRKLLIHELVVANRELALRNEEIGQLAAIVKSSEDAIISKSLDGIIKSWNNAAEKMFGYSAKQAIGKNILLIIPPEYINEEKAILEKICNNEIIEHYQTIRMKKSGEQFHVSLTVSPVKDNKEKIIGVSKIVREITKQKEAEGYTDKELEIVKLKKEVNELLRQVGKTDRYFILNE
jgi:PAS domain S-box-containing protein